MRTQMAFCVVCGGSMDIPVVHPSSNTWSHSDPQACVAVLRAQRETLQGEVEAWRKRAQQAEAALSAAREGALREAVHPFPLLLTWLGVLHESGPISSVDWKMVAGWALRALASRPEPAPCSCGRTAETGCAEEGRDARHGA